MLWYRGEEMQAKLSSANKPGLEAVYNDNAWGFHENLELQHYNSRWFLIQDKDEQAKRDQGAADEEDADHEGLDQGV